MKTPFNSIFRSLILLVGVVFLYIPNLLAEQPQSELVIRKFLHDIFNMEVNNIKIEPGEFCLSIGFPHKIVFINNTAHTIEISLDDTKIYSFSENRWSSSETALVEGKGHQDAISETDAFTSAIPLLDYFGFSTQKHDYKMVFRDNAHKTTSSVEDLWGASWDIRKDLNFNGILCRGRYVLVIISAASGKIVSFLHKPVIEPQNTMNVEITYAAAQQVALAWLMTAPHFTGKSPTINTTNTQGEIVIAPKKDISQENTSCEDAEDAIVTYYCWEVDFNFLENEKSNPGKIWVNVETGEVIGE